MAAAPGLGWPALDTRSGWPSGRPSGRPAPGQRPGSDPAARIPGSRPAAASEAALAKDAAVKDAVPRDAGPRGAGPRDAGPRDAGPRDVGTRDAGTRDVVPRGAGAIIDPVGLRSDGGLGWPAATGTRPLRQRDQLGREVHYRADGGAVLATIPAQVRGADRVTGLAPGSDMARAASLVPGRARGAAGVLPVSATNARDTVSGTGSASAGDPRRSAGGPVSPDRAAQEQPGRLGSAGQVSRGTGLRREQPAAAGWRKQQTEQESETEMAEGRAQVSADQHVSRHGAATGGTGAQTARHAGPMTGGGSGPARAETTAGATLDTPIARAARAAVAARGGQAWPRPGSCRIITIANQKGGVGKTTTAVNLAAGLALHGARVLVVDLDPQGNASTALDVEHHAGVVSVYNVLVDGQPLAAIVQPVTGIPQLYCAPATIDLAGAEIELVPLVARESRLARAVAGYDASDLDYIFIDCPPSLGLLTVNALVAAPEVLIPIQCEYYALEGLEQLLRTVDLVRSHLNPGLTVSTILLTMFDGRTRLASQVADEVREHFGDVVLGSVIPRSVRVSEAPSYGQSVMTYDPGSSGAVAYMEAAREMAHRNARPGRVS
jgi:chromosome partitioning protein